jgi:hypothetical protein
MAAAIRCLRSLSENNHSIPQLGWDAPSPDRDVGSAGPPGGSRRAPVRERGQFWRATTDSFLWGNSAGALRVMTRHDPLPVTL